MCLEVLSRLEISALQASAFHFGVCCLVSLYNVKIADSGRASVFGESSFALCGK